MKKIKELPMIEKGKLHIGCLNCSTASYELDMNRILAVGFGETEATKDHMLVYSETKFNSENPDAKDSDFLTAQYIEDMAVKDPEHDWRVRFYGPLHGETYQRHRDGKWVCIESNKGFA
jgi:ribosomal protein L37E